MSAQITVVVRNEDGAPLDATVTYYNSAGEQLGETALHDPTGNVLQTSYDIPDGTTQYRFEAPGYLYYATSVLYDSNTITLVKEKHNYGYLALGAAAVLGLIWLKVIKL